MKPAISNLATMITPEKDMAPKALATKTRQTIENDRIRSEFTMCEKMHQRLKMPFDSEMLAIFFSG
jgi:hypothetical protein